MSLASRDHRVSLASRGRPERPDRGASPALTALPVWTGPRDRKASVAQTGRPARRGRPELRVNRDPRDCRALRVPLGRKAPRDHRGCKAPPAAS